MRTPIADLQLAGSTNIRRALGRAPLKKTTKSAELEQIFADLLVRRAEALADLKKNGMILTVEKFPARGALILVKVTNPALKIAQQCERQLVTLAQQLTAPEGEGNKKTSEQILREVDEILGASN